MPWRQVLLLEAGTNDPNRTQEETKNNHINYRGARRHKSLDCSPRRNENACCMEYALAVSSSDKTGREMRVANGGAPILYWSCFCVVVFSRNFEGVGRSVENPSTPWACFKKLYFSSIEEGFPELWKKDFQSQGVPEPWKGFPEGLIMVKRPHKPYTAL